MEKSLLDIFRTNLKFYRVKNKITQEQLSEYLEKNANYIGLIENGKSVPPLPVIEEIAKKLGVKPMLLFDAEGCQENIIKSGKEDFAKDLSEKLSENLKQQIYTDICSLL